MAKYLLAHDLGTSGDKVTLFDTDGNSVSSSTIQYPVHYFGGHCAEQNPDDWWRAVAEGTRRAIEGIRPADVLGVSFSAQMQCCLPADREGRPLRPAMIWADHRAVREKEFLTREIGFEDFCGITGHRPNESYTLEKIMWLKSHEPDVYRKTYKVLQVKDYIIFRMTGAFVTDYSDASGTNALDLRRMDWSEPILTASGIAPALFPELHQSVDVAGYVTREASELTGLAEGTPVVCGGGDGPCSAVGAGCVKDDELFATFGTSAWIGGTSKQFFEDNDHILMCFAHVIPGKYMPCGTMQAAGSSYSYIRSLLEPGRPYEELDGMMEAAGPGAGGLIFLPYLIGERAPRWNEKCSGAFLGMRMEHGKPEYLRAVIEGVAMNLNLILEAYRRQMRAEEMILTGGGARSDTVCQILSDVLQVRLNVPDHVDTATSMAAAVIAGVGVGVYPDFGEIRRFLGQDRSFRPDQRNAALYQQMERIFDDSYHALEPVFDELETLHRDEAGAGEQADHA
jgi:xylulokinase